MEIPLAPSAPTEDSDTVESLGFAPDATMQDVMMALHDSRKRDRQLYTVTEEQDGDDDRPSQRRRRNS